MVVLCRRKKWGSIFLYFLHTLETEWEHEHKSIQYSRDMTARLTASSPTTWPCCPHPIRADDYRASDIALSLLTMTAFELWLFLHYTNHWKPLPQLTLNMGVTIQSGLLFGINNILLIFFLPAPPSSGSSRVEPFVKVTFHGHGQFITSCHMYLLSAPFHNPGKHMMNFYKV